MLALIVVQLFFGLCLPLNKMALSIMPPLLFIGMRLTVGGLLLLGRARLRGTRIRRTAAAVLLPLMPTILLGIMLKGLCKYHALYRTDVAHVALLLATTPVWAALFSNVLLGEKLTRRQTAAIYLGVTATAAYALQGCTKAIACGLPTLLLATAIAADSYSYALLRRISLTCDTPKTFIAGLRMLCGGLPLFALALANGELCNGIEMCHGSLLLLIIVSGSLAHVSYLHLLKRHPAPLVALADLLGPFFAILFAWGMLQEQPTWQTGVAGSIILLAIVVFQRSQKDH